MIQNFLICSLIILSYPQQQSASRSYLWDRNLQVDSVTITAKNFHMFKTKFHFQKYIGLNEVNRQYCNRSHNGPIELHPAQRINSCVPIASYIVLPPVPGLIIAPEVIRLNRCHSWNSEFDCQPTTVRRKDIPVTMMIGGETCEEVISLVEHTQCTVCSEKDKRKKCSGTWLPYPHCNCLEEIVETTVLPPRFAYTHSPVQPTLEDYDDEDNGTENNHDSVTGND